MTLRLLCSSLFVLGLLASCEGDPDLALSVDLRTDYVAGVEFVGARLTIDGTVADETLSGAESYVDGRRLFEVEGLGSSARRGLTVSLLNGAGGVLASRDVVIRHEEDTAVTVVMTRDCSAVVCGEGESCLAGNCVDQGCTDGVGELCEEPECAADAECPAMAACSVPACRDGLCLYDALECDPGLYCAAETGCEPVPVTVADMGVATDAGPRDAGAPDLGAPDLGPPDLGAPDLGPTGPLAFEACAFVTGSATQSIPAIDAPAYARSVEDPVFRTTVWRASDQGPNPIAGFLGSNWSDLSTHAGSTRPVWNADGTALYVESGNTGIVLRAADYLPLQLSPFVTAQSDEVWHPPEPDLRLAVRDDTLFQWSVGTGSATDIAAFPGYRSLTFGAGMGRASDDGRALVLTGENERGDFVAFVYDLAGRIKGPDIVLSTDARWATISPSGSYVVVRSTVSTDIYDRVGAPVGERWAFGEPTAFDLVQESGRDYAIGLARTTTSTEDGVLLRRSLADGAIEVLTSAPITIGGGQVSAQNVRLPGWVFVGVSAGASTPYRGELVAVRTDGSGRIVRLAHTHGMTEEPFDGPQVSPSPDGRQIAFVSDWARDQAVYVVDTARPCTP